MSSNRLVQWLKDKFQDQTVEKRCIETSIERILDKDASRLFDKFPDLFEKNDPRIKALSSQLNALYMQLYRNQYDPHSKFPVEKNVKKWLTNIAIMGRQELLNSDGSIKYQIVKLLKWDHVTNLVDIHKMIQAYVSMVLPQVMIYSKENNQFSPDNYGAMILECSNKFSAEYIQEALQPKNDDIDLSVLIPIGVAVVTAVSGLIAWSLFSDSDEKESEELEVINPKRELGGVRL